MRGGGYTHSFDSITSLENLLCSWDEFICGKRKKVDVAEFSLRLSENLFVLHRELKQKFYQHSGYQAFKINDPKPRDIHKAVVKDRLLHHAIYRVLYPYFDRKFIYDSYSCRIEKGTHKAINRFRDFSRKVSRNNTRTCWVLKCDIRKFFASIDHQILKTILAKHIEDTNTLWLLWNILDSFHTYSARSRTISMGLPLGNLTSQLLVNIYMNEFDQYMKHVLKVKYYIRYADDFVILSEDKAYLENLLSKISSFLASRLKLALHPDKVFIKTIASGVDFLGWVHFPDHRVLRTATKRRMLRNIEKDITSEAVASYKGMLSHGDAYDLTQLIEKGSVGKPESYFV